MFEFLYSLSASVKGELSGNCLLVPPFVESFMFLSIFAPLLGERLLFLSASLGERESLFGNRS